MENQNKGFNKGSSKLQVKRSISP